MFPTIHSQRMKAVKCRAHKSSLTWQRYLKKELEEIGASDVRLSDHCYAYAKIPSNLDKKVPAIGFIAHMDTSPALSGKDIKPQIIQNYDGGVIKLGESGFSMGPNEFPALAELKGKESYYYRWNNTSWRR